MLNHYNQIKFVKIPDTQGTILFNDIFNINFFDSLHALQILAWIFLSSLDFMTSYFNEI